MDKSSIIKSVQGQDEEKVGFSLKLPKSLKEDLQSLCEEKSISMNAVIVATLQSLINDDCGKEIKGMKRLLLSYREDINKRITYLENGFEQHGTSLETQQEHNELESTLQTINTILGV